MTGVGGTPSSPVVAEDIRDLKRWAGHGVEPLPGGPAPSLPALATVCAEIVERAVDA
jgi:hypothetical protein